LDLPHELQAGAVGQADVADQQVDDLELGNRQRADDPLGEPDLVAVALELRIDGDTELLSVTQDGSFAFQARLERGASYTVELVNPDVPCTLRSGTGVIADADAAIELTCPGASLGSVVVSGIAPVVTVVPGTNDYVVEMDALAGATHILTATENGYGKRTEIGLYRKQSRGGMGIIDIKTTPRNGKVVGVKAVGEEDQMMLSTTGGMVARMRVKRISVVGRNTQGVRLMVLEPGDKIASVAKVVERGEDTGQEIAPPEPTPEELAQLEKESKEEEKP
jgi:DNA gyrase/topoisomerase IV subunit A